MTRTLIKIVEFRRWFPPDDPVAVKLARACILREDLLIEMRGILAESTEEFDGASPEYRRMYFLRGLFRSYTELSSVLQGLFGCPTFRTLLDKQTESLKQRFEEQKRIIVEVHPLLKGIRNDVCGHVLEQAVRGALERIPPQAFGFLEISETVIETHYKFVSEFVAEMLLKDVSPDERKNLRSTQFGSIASILPVFSLIELCLGMYAMDRTLIPSRPL
jgi:hypothetical protein